MGAFLDTPEPHTIFGKNIVLTTSADWDRWLVYIKLYAQVESVWNLINPDLPAEPDLPTEPVRPTPAFVKPGAILEDELDDEELSATRNEGRKLLARTVVLREENGRVNARVEHHL